jgi:Na+-transporting methylmalonyl-CoA/oxaloacetate decarboxylase gamma subunit
MVTLAEAPPIPASDNAMINGMSFFMLFLEVLVCLRGWGKCFSF